MINIFLRLIIIFLFSTQCILASEDMLDFEITIKNHKFIPEKIEVPANRKIRLIVHNQDDNVEEFESIDLKREKIIPGKTTVRIILAPLKSGNYHYFGEFHQETAKGYIEVKD